MIKTYISSLLIVLLAGAQVVQAQDNLDDVFAQLDAAQGTEEAVAAPVVAEVVVAEEAAVVESAAPAVAEKSLLAKGIDLYQAGKYSDAETVFEAILAENPYDRSAMAYLQRTAQRISAREVRKQSASRAQAIADINAAWNVEPDGSVAVIVDDKDAVKSADELAIEAMEARLKNIVIPSLDFRDANIKDVVLFLTETCRRLDAGGQGVNILLLGMEDSMAGGQNNITISIRDMNLYEALQYIVEMASLKFDVKAKAVAISPVNYVAEADMVLKSFAVVPEVGMEMESMSGGEGGGADDLFGDSSSSSATGPADVSGFFSIVDWPEGSSAIYQPNFHKLFVKNTPKNIAAVEEILAELEDDAIAKRSQQVEIEAKFVEFAEGALQELGFDWDIAAGKINGEIDTLGLGGLKKVNRYRAASGTDASGGSLLTPLDSEGKQLADGYAVLADKQNLFGAGQRSNADGVFSKVSSGVLNSMGGNPAAMLFNVGEDLDLQINAMEQEGTADVLSAPKVTTKSGNEAVIRVVEVHRYPQDYDVETGQRTAPVVKPQDWEDYDLGVVLKVTPVVDSENNTIDLDLQPEIKSFTGFEFYKVGDSVYDSSGNNASEPVFVGPGDALYASMPYFEVRSIQTQVTIADGSTVMMGGLVDERTETFRDQVPFLGDIPYIGRLFRTEGSRTAKKNLIIYVKATQVDDKGMTRAKREALRQAAK